VVGGVSLESIEGLALLHIALHTLKEAWISLGHPILTGRFKISMPSANHNPCPDNQQEQKDRKPVPSSTHEPSIHQKSRSSPETLHSITSEDWSHQQ
jgi:hypothetical protein